MILPRFQPKTDGFVRYLQFVESVTVTLSGGKPIIEGYRDMGIENFLSRIRAVVFHHRRPVRYARSQKAGNPPFRISCEEVACR